MRSYRLSEKTLNILLYICLLAASAFAQPGDKAAAAACDIGTLRFACPEDFVRLPDVDDTTRLFRFQYKTTVVYFFISVPVAKFDEMIVANSIGRQYSNGASPFRWKKMKDPLMMGMKTRYEKKVASLLGYDGYYLINVKSASFKVDDKNIVLGYAWDSGEKLDKQQKFARAEELGDQGIGCNAVVSTLNSITKEFPQARQYCFSSMASFPK